jgi:hypothetical protein
LETDLPHATQDQRKTERREITGQNASEWRDRQCKRRKKRLKDWDP